MSYTSFDQMKGKLAAKPGVTNPGGLAAFLARKKYGDAEVQKYASESKSMRTAKKKARKRK